MRIRKAVANDVPMIEACAEAAYAKYVDRMGQRPDPMDEDYSDAVRRGRLFIFCGEDTISGFVVFYERGDHLHLENLAVHPKNQRSGVGKSLIDFVEECALRGGFRAIELYTNASMVENIEWYRTIGFSEIARRSEVGFDRVFFRRPIPR